MEPKALMNSFSNAVKSLSDCDAMKKHGQKLDESTVTRHLQGYRYDKNTKGLNDADAMTVLKMLGIQNTDANNDGKTDVTDVSFALCNLMQFGMGPHQQDNKFDSTEAAIAILLAKPDDAIHSNRYGQQQQYGSYGQQQQHFWGTSPYDPKLIDPKKN